MVLFRKQTERRPEHPPHINEDVIMTSFREGNEMAFRTIYDDMVRPLTWFAHNIIRNQADTEDIVANAFYKLFHARETMRNFEHIKRWLYITVRNEAIDYLRSKTRIRENQQEMAWFESGVDEHVETERVRSVLLQDISKEIDNLPRQRSRIVRLYYFEQKNTAEIAEILQLSPQTVLNQKTKALDALKKSNLLYKWLADGIPEFILAAAVYASYLVII